MFEATVNMRSRVFGLEIFAKILLDCKHSFHLLPLQSKWTKCFFVRRTVKETRLHTKIYKLKAWNLSEAPIYVAKRAELRGSEWQAKWVDERRWRGNPTANERIKQTPFEYPSKHENRKYAAIYKVSLIKRLLNTIGMALAIFWTVHRYFGCHHRSFSKFFRFFFFVSFKSMLVCVYVCC